VYLFGLCPTPGPSPVRARYRERWGPERFAGLLTEIGLPPGRLAAALLGFNLGVEAGQLALVALAWPLLYLALRGGRERRAVVAQLGSTPVLSAGLYWFLTRALG
jgi:hypothetical protein